MIDYVLKDMGFKYIFLNADGSAALETLELATQPSISSSAIG